MCFTRKSTMMFLSLLRASELLINNRLQLKFKYNQNILK